MAANPLQEAAVAGVELEAFAKGIPDLVYKGNSDYKWFKENSKTYPTAVSTTRGGVNRPAFFIPTRMQSGAAIFQGTGNGDALNRGTGSLWVSGDLSPVFVASGCEITWLARQATEGKKRSLISLRAEELKNSFDAFMSGLSALFNSDGSGAILQIPSTATVNNNTGTGNQTSSIIGLGGQANQFQEQQIIQIFPTEGGSARITPSTATVSYVDGAADTVYFSTALPTSTAAGDFVMIQGSSGALNSSVQGIYSYQVSSNTGTTPTNLNRATYPGQLSTPTITYTGPVTPNFAYRCEILIARALGLENEAVKNFVFRCGLDQQLAINNLYQNVVIANAQDVKGDRSLDMTKRYMPNTYGGRELNVSVTARQGRIDSLCPETWGIIETVEPSLYDFGDGVTNMPVPANDGTGNTTYLTSNVFYYCADLNLYNSNYKAGVYGTGFTVPATS
jgi:hypothetical protein